MCHLGKVDVFEIKRTSFLEKIIHRTRRDQVEKDNGCEKLKLTATQADNLFHHVIQMIDTDHHLVVASQAS